MLSKYLPKLPVTPMLPTLTEGWQSPYYLTFKQYFIYLNIPYSFGKLSFLGSGSRNFCSSPHHFSYASASFEVSSLSIIWTHMFRPVLGSYLFSCYTYSPAAASTSSQPTPWELSTFNLSCTCAFWPKCIFVYMFLASLHYHCLSPRQSQ